VFSCGAVGFLRCWAVPGGLHLVGCDRAVFFFVLVSGVVVLVLVFWGLPLLSVFLSSGLAVAFLCSFDLAGLPPMSFFCTLGHILPFLINEW
jgi:hypothetical protein